MAVYSTRSNRLLNNLTFISKLGVSQSIHRDNAPAVVGSFQSSLVRCRARYNVLRRLSPESVKSDIPAAPKDILCSLPRLSVNMPVHLCGGDALSILNLIIYIQENGCPLDTDRTNDNGSGDSLDRVESTEDSIRQKDSEFLLWTQR